MVAALKADRLRKGPRGSAWFAHHDGDGRLTGFEMRGPDYQGFSTGGDKTLFRLPRQITAGSATVNRLVVAEAPIDAMSHRGKSARSGTAPLCDIVRAMDRVT